MIASFARCRRAIVSVVVIGSPLSAQCESTWQQAIGDGFPREGNVLASTLWDPDGAGPETARLVIAGDMRTATYIAAWDPASGDWSPFSVGMNGPVHALLALPNGDLVAGGDFTTAGGSAIDIARWDGTSWSALGLGTGTAVTSQVRALAQLPNGDIVAGGWFPQMGGVAVNHIARWNGTAWAPLGTGMSSWVFSLETLANGDLVAGGAFSSAGGVAANGVARWDGTNWTALGSGPGLSVRAMTTLPNGDLVAGGDNANPVSPHVACWDGATWTPLGVGTDDRVRALATLPNGDVVAGGWFTSAGGVAANHVARWNGASWSPFGAGVDATVAAVTPLPNGDIVVGGESPTAAGARIARWNGTGWDKLGSGLGDGLSTGSTTPWVWAVTHLPNDDLVIGGAFRNVGDVVASCIARWDGTSWSPLGNTLGGFARWVFDLVVMPNGDLVAAGSFWGGALSMNNIALWDGATWSPLGIGTSISSGPAGAAVNALGVLPNGDLIAGGGFTSAGGVPADRVARWDGTAWSALGTGVSGTVNAVAVFSNGDVVVGGLFSTAGGVSSTRGVALWNGTSWSALGAGVASGAVYSLTVLPSGDLIAGGSFSRIGGVAAAGVARWDGSAWSPMGAGLNGLVQALGVLPNGDVVAGGTFNNVGDGLARWDGSSWSAVTAHMAGCPEAMTMTPDGELVVVGAFSAINERFMAGVARLTPDCPATTSSQSSGCTGTGGLVLAAHGLPFVGSTFQSTTTGFSPGALGVAVVGLTNPNVLLSSLHPSGTAGCKLLASLDSQALLLPVGGQASSGITLPNDPVFAGLTLFRQTLELEFVPTLSLRSSNGVAAVIGAL